MKNEKGRFHPCIRAGVFCVFYVICVTIGFLLALKGPASTTPLPGVSVNCDHHARLPDTSSWFLPLNKTECARLNDSKTRDNFEVKQIIFSQMLPLPRDGVQLDMSRWFQMMIAVLQLDISYQPNNPLGKNQTIQLYVQLGARDTTDAEDDWKLIASGREEQILECTIDEDDQGPYHRCLFVPLFQLSSVHYQHYLLNVHIPADESVVNPKRIKRISVNGICQNGIFTKVWFSLKTVLFPILLGVLIWYWRRIQQLSRLPNLLERYLFYLGCVLMVYNVPIEWLTLYTDLPLMRLINTIREVALYAMLLLFWDLYFQRPLTGFRRPRTVLTVMSSVFFLVFQMIDRIQPLVNPFRGVWSTPKGISIWLTCGFVLLSFVYLFSLLFSFIKCWLKLKHLNSDTLFKKTGLNRDVYSLLVASVTVLIFIMKLVVEENWREGGAINITVPGFVYFGIYCLWNYHVISMMTRDQVEVTDCSYERVKMTEDRHEKD